MDAANTKSTMTDAAMAALAAAGGSLDDKLVVAEFDENSPDDLMDHIDREIGTILSSNVHAVQSRNFLLANNGVLGRAQLSARDKTRAQLNTFLEVGDVDTTRTEDYLRKFSELSGGYKSPLNSGRRVALDDTALLPSQSLSSRGYHGGTSFRKRFRRAVTIQSPTFSFTPDNLTPRIPTCESAYTMAALRRANCESDPETCEDDYENKCHKLSFTDIPPVFLKRDTSHLQNDFYQTVSEMGGGARLSGNESTDESMRDFKASLDLDAVRIRHELEREYREKQTRHLIDSHSSATQPRVVQEAIAQNGRKANEHKREAVWNARTHANTNANANVNVNVNGKRKNKASTNGHDTQLNEASDLEPSGRGDLMDEEDEESGQERPAAVEAGSSQKRVTVNETMSQKGKRFATQAENGRTSSGDAAKTRTAARGQHRAPHLDAIQRESNATTSENVTPTLSPRETLEKKLLELTEMNLTVRRLQKDKDKILEELQSLRNHIDQYQTQMQKAERCSNDSRSRADDVRSELRTIERKRDAALGELHSMNASLATKKSALRSVEQRLKKSITEIEALESLGISRDDIDTVIDERNRLLEMVQQKEQECNARYELEKQLSKSQEQTRSLERRLISEKIEPLEHQLSSKLQQLQDAQSEKDGYRVRVQQLEEKLANQENEYSRIVREKQNELEATRQACDKELRDVRDNASLDASRMRAECDQRCADVERRLQFEKDQAVAAVKRDLVDTKTQLQMRQQESSLQDARHNDELLILRDHFEAEKQVAMKDLEMRLSREQNLKISDVEAEFLAQIGNLNRQLSARELELSALKQHTLEKDDLARQTIERVKAEMQHDFDDALQRERTRMLEENEAAWREEVRALKDEMHRVISALNSQLAHEHEFNDVQRSKIAELESLLLSERDKQRQLSREKLDAINRTRETTRDELEKEFNTQMEALIRKHKQEAANIRESFRQLERDLDQLRSDRAPSTVQLDERPSASASTKSPTGLTWKETLVFVEEVNEECRKTAALLGLRARVVDIDEAHEMHQLGVQTGLHHAVANMKASNQLLRKYAEDVRLAQEDARQKLDFTEEQHVQEIAQLKQTHEREFRELRERMREQEQQLFAVRTRVTNIERPAISPVHSGSDRSSSSHDDTLAELRKREDELRHLKAGMEQWKEETASRMGKRLQEEFKAEFDRKIHELKSSLKQKWKKRQTANQRGGVYSSQDDSTGPEDTARRFDALGSLRESSRRSRPVQVQTSLVDMVESGVLANGSGIGNGKGTQDIGLQIKSASLMSASAATELISYLQERVKDLRVENMGLRKRMVDSGLPVPENSAAETIGAFRNASPDRRSQLSRRLNDASLTASRSSRVPLDSVVSHARNLEADVF